MDKRLRDRWIGKHTPFRVPSNEGSLTVARTAIAISSALPQLVATTVVQTLPLAPPWTELNYGSKSTLSTASPFAAAVGLTRQDKFQ